MIWSGKMLKCVMARETDRNGAQVQFVFHSAGGKDKESVRARFALIATAWNDKIEL